MPEDPRLDLLRRACAAFNRRDVEVVLALLSPDVEWPNVATGTVLHGRAAVQDYWTRQFAQIDPHVDPLAFAVEGDLIAVDVHQVIRDRTGSLLADSRVTHVYTFRDGLVRRMTVRA